MKHNKKNKPIEIVNYLSKQNKQIREIKLNNIKKVVV